MRGNTPHWAKCRFGGKPPRLAEVPVIVAFPGPGAHFSRVRVPQILGFARDLCEAPKIPVARRYAPFRRNASICSVSRAPANIALNLPNQHVCLESHAFLEISTNPQNVSCAENAPFCRNASMCSTSRPQPTSRSTSPITCFPWGFLSNLELAILAVIHGVMHKCQRPGPDARSKRGGGGGRIRGRWI